MRPTERLGTLRRTSGGVEDVSGSEDRVLEMGGEKVLLAVVEEAKMGGVVVVAKRTAEVVVDVFALGGGGCADTLNIQNNNNASMAVKECMDDMLVLR